MSKNKIIELVPTFLAPVTENSRKSFSASLIIFHNAGTVNVTIADSLTVKPGGTFQLGITNDRNSIVHTGPINIRFATGGTNRLEIVTLAPNTPEFANYEQQ